MRRKTGHKLVRSGVMVVGGLCATLVMTGVTTTSAYADQVSGEGSVSDTQNILNATVSDESASAGDFMPLSTVNNIEAGYGGCNGTFTEPGPTYKSDSPTLQGISADLQITCNGYNYIDLTLHIQRSRWYGWQNLDGSGISKTGGTENYRSHWTDLTNCRAGTWSYRSEVTGGWDGSYNGEAHSESFRHTCVDQSNVNYVDQS